MSKRPHETPTIHVHWVDRGHDPTQPPNLDFPTGTDIDLTGGMGKGCKTSLPYPAKRCG
nr:hypothetical protein [Bradyrhizobium sp.]CUT16612.1 hypothetical protein CDS [Bradyrhizobium sp.]